MWKELPEDQKTTYKQLITNFASLSEAFAQKADDDDSEDSDSSDAKTLEIAPIVNSKFQETVFHRAFNAKVEDIANSSFDASIVLDDPEKYFLVGIKSFGIGSGDQKIAQFKRENTASGWATFTAQVTANALQATELANQKAVQAGKEKATPAELKKAINEINYELYLQMATTVAELRNQRIRSAQNILKGFKFDEVDPDAIESVYHVLMPSKKGGDSPKIYVGETSYNEIDIDTLEILGATKVDKPFNFKFKDQYHTYKFTPSDSQLSMAFNNRDIVVDEFDIEYIEDAVTFFEKLHDNIGQVVPEEEIEESYSWMLADENGEFEESSGYNAFDGMAKAVIPQRKRNIDKIESMMRDLDLDDNLVSKVVSDLNTFMINEETRKPTNKVLRSKILTEVEEIGDVELTQKVRSSVLRPAYELYIPIPDAHNFHDAHPDFFGPGIGTFKEDDRRKLRLPTDQRKFLAEFVASGDQMEFAVMQDNGKAIESKGSQELLGRWILQGIFQLPERTLLTEDALFKAGVNAIRFIKYKNPEKPIGVQFFWIDLDDIPEDTIAWAGELRKAHLEAESD
ncbi:phospholipase D-like domain-containing protein [Weissella paramesenteroides]|uniref:hypothetical protein n=1 Tax=Weissella paramesenteroides TaxID=1249 RepID=UPI003890E18C